MAKKAKKDAAPATKEKKGGDKASRSSIIGQLKELKNQGILDTEASGGFEDLPAGQYEVQFASVTIGNAKKSGRLQVAFDMEVVSGDSTGRHIYKYSGIDSEENVGRFKGDLAKLGHEWDGDPEALLEILETLEGTRAILNLVDDKRGDGQWKNFVRAIDESEESDEEVESEESEESEDSSDDEEPEENEDEEDSDGDGDSDSSDDEDDDDDTEDDDGDGESEEDNDDEDEEEEEKAHVELKTKTKPNEEQIDAIVSMAKKASIDSKPYASKKKYVDLLCDIAEAVGISGEFTSIDLLIGKARAALKKHK